VENGVTDQQRSHARGGVDAAMDTSWVTIDDRLLGDT